MQPASPEASTTATLVDQIQDSSSSTSQHGLSDHFPQTSGGRATLWNHRESSTPSEETDDASVTSGSTRRGRRNDAGRMSSREGSSQEGSPGSRIDEYEKAHRRVRKPRQDGMIFQVVPTAKGKDSRLSIQDFPNGADDGIPLAL